MCYDDATDRAEIAKVSRKRWLGQRNRKVATRSNAMELAVSQWLMHYGKERFKEINRKLVREGIGSLKRSVVEKIDPSQFSRLEAQLFNLLRKYGFAQMNDAADDAAKTVRHKWVMPRQVHAEMNDKLANKVVLLVRETESGVRGSIKQLVTDALLEKPRPSARELGRRIARQWFGPPKIRPSGRPDIGLRGTERETLVTADWRRSQREVDAGGREHIFSFARAQTIARTELAQAENAGIAEGFADAGVRQVKWLARRNDGRSGKRRHYLMNQHKSITIEAMQGTNKQEWFKLPSGVRAPYPNWIGLPAGETVNCRCVLVPA